MTQTVFITGATSGIGRATALLFGKNGYRLIVCGRRQERLEQLKNLLSGHTPVQTLCFDISRRNQVERALAQIPDDLKQVDILINNAGNAHGLMPIHEGDIDDWDRMIDVNVKGLLYVTRQVVEGMVARKKGHIVNIGSIAGKEVYPRGNVYNASKFAVDALGKAMLMDLNPHGIRVSNINPGLVKTEFSLVRFKGDHVKAAQVYEGYQPLSAEDVAEAIYWVATRPTHINISDMVILPTAQASATIVHKEKDI